MRLTFRPKDCEERESSWGSCRCAEYRSLVDVVERRPAVVGSAASDVAVAAAEAVEDAVAGETWAVGPAGCRRPDAQFDTAGSVTQHAVRI